MSSRVPVAPATALAAVLLAGGCGSLDDVSLDSSINYKSPGSQGSNALEVPPDLVNTLEPEGGADTYSQFVIGNIPDQEAVLPQVTNARYRREHGIRWVEVDLPPNEAWVVVRKYWGDLGFALEIDSPETGIMETNWLENRSRIYGTGFTEFLDKALGRFQDTGERDKYRTRIERGADPQSTEIHVTHRGVQEVATRSGYQFRRVPNDPSLEVEVLRQIMLRFSGNEEAAEQQIARAEEQEAEPLKFGDDWMLIKEADPGVAWRKVAIALDRAGFTITERSREDATFLIRYSDERVESPDDDGLIGGLASFFSTSDAVKASNILIRLEPGEDGETRLKVTAEDGSALPEKVAPDIVALLSEHI